MGQRQRRRENSPAAPTAKSASVPSHRLHAAASLRRLGAHRFTVHAALEQSRHGSDLRSPSSDRFSQSAFPGPQLAARSDVVAEQKRRPVEDLDRSGTRHPLSRDFDLKLAAPQRDDAARHNLTVHFDDDVGRRRCREARADVIRVRWIRAAARH